MLNFKSINLRPLNIDKNIVNNNIMGYEPYFNKLVIVATIDKKNNTIRPAHGYFPQHPYGLTTKKYAKKHGFNYNDN